MNFQKNKDEVFQAVANATEEAHRPQNSVKIIAVTKYVDSSIAKDLLKTGIEHIGENRVDKFLEKYEALADLKLTWHLIGSLQRRKVKDIINYLDYFHALDSVKLAAEIQKRANKPIKCFLQVNVSKEESKHGFMVEDIHQAIETIKNYDKIELVGLMTMAPFGADADQLKDIFSKTHALQKELQQLGIANMPFTELSMGMSGDFKEAIANGSTFVRIGTAFFK
ncbi:YggS family pyridoxal phosphate-dependent enzyme [Streptococcus sp.]|jgi:pyridoxal phosphate enzyme (YggS family)|uniref:YggS family pyridoxal phosphate-dependent enzyme n=1 Tax=Streptococcus sp. TaxID=1306 RepID=UPI00391C1C54